MSNEEKPLFPTERIELKSVGIDIGSSTSHLMFSKVVLRRLGVILSSRFVTVERKVTYQSPILLTPYVEGRTIDVERLSKFIISSYKSAEVALGDIDTGAVICTGEAAKKRNAEAIVELFSKEAGKFVCATAGANMEAVMAAHGSGAVARSLGNNGESKVVMNVDVGGGTSKIAIARDGLVIDTAAINVGARLVATDSNARITRIEEAGRLVAENAGFNLKLEATLPEGIQASMAEILSEALLNVLRRTVLNPFTQKLMITEPVKYKGPIDLILFSGGVSEYVYGRERRNYGDLGKLLGRQIKRKVEDRGFGIPLIEPDQRIRATVIGASQYTVQVSGNTIFISNKNVLPLRNLPVVSPIMGDKPFASAAVSQAIHEAMKRHDVEKYDHPLALSFHWDKDPSHEHIQVMRRGILDALKGEDASGVPMVLIFDADVASLIGKAVASSLPTKSVVVSIDGVEVGDLDYIDIGKEMPKTHAVPVVVKSLVFGAGAQNVYERQASASAKLR